MSTVSATAVEPPPTAIREVAPQQTTWPVAVLLGDEKKLYFISCSSRAVVVVLVHNNMPPYRIGSFCVELVQTVGQRFLHTIYIGSCKGSCKSSFIDRVGTDGMVYCRGCSNDNSWSRVAPR